MKKPIKKIIAGFMSVVLVLTTLFALSINVASAATSGQCTSTINWSYNTTTKTLTLTGSGVMPDYRATNIGTNKKSPWESEKVGSETIKSQMEHLVVGEGITEIGEYNFYNCVKLKTAQLPSTLKSIDGMGAGTDLASASYGAFQNCESLTEIIFPEGLETIEPYAFKNCKTLKSVSFPNSLKTLGKCAFLLCSALETVTFPVGELTEIGENVFNSCGVKRIYWGSITDVSAQAFYSCNIKDVEFPEQIKSIGSRAFANNTSLMNVKIYNASMEFKGTNSKTSNNFSGSNQTVTIIGHSASTAQKFASDYSYNFVSMDDCDHTDTRTEVIKEATCTETGTQQIICNDCEFLVNESEIPALGHNYVLSAENDSTELDGHIYRSYICSRCQAENETVEHAMAADSIYHVWKEGYYDISYVVEPSCTTSGIATYTCTVDGCVNALGRPTSDRIIVESGHKVENWNETPATCTTPGSRTGVCTVCKEKITETIPATGHKYDDTNLIEEDTIVDEENGHTYYYYDCQNCNEKAEEMEHNEWVEGCYTRRVITEATCTILGLARDTCDICGEIRTAVLEATGEHVYEETDRKEPTCTARGTITYTCSVCNQTRTEYIPATGHDYVLDEEASKAPTCTESGKNVYLCSVCSATKTETVEATGHTPAEGTYNIVTQPTCTKTGLAVASCSVCSSAYEETVEALGHDFEEVETDLASEGKPGHVLSTPTCKRCGTTDTGRVVHKDWIEGYYKTSGTSVATCETTYSIDTCNICNERRSVANPGIGHEFIFTSQTYQGVNLICRHCATRTLVSPQTLLDYWEEVSPINMTPNRTATDNSGYLDLDGNRIINSKDYSRILYLIKNEAKLIAEREQAEGMNYNRIFEDGGEISSMGSLVRITDGNEGKGYEFAFTPAESGTYRFYSAGRQSAFAYLEKDEDNTWLAYDEGTAFSIEYYCEEGVTYHIKTGLVDAGITGNFYLFAAAVTSGGTSGDGEEGSGGIGDLIGDLIPGNNN